MTERNEATKAHEFRYIRTEDTDPPGEGERTMSKRGLARRAAPTTRE